MGLHRMEVLAWDGVALGVVSILAWVGAMYATGCLNPNGCLPSRSYIENGTLGIVLSISVVVLAASLFDLEYERSRRRTTPPRTTA